MSNNGSITIHDGGTSYTGPAAVDLYRMRMILSGLKMEERGMRLTRKAPTCLSIAKKEFGLKGNRIRVREQFEQLLAEAQLDVPVVDERTEG